MTKTFTLIKKIAKHGSQAIIVIPKLLEEQLSPGKIVQLTIEIISSEKVPESHIRGKEEYGQ